MINNGFAKSHDSEFMIRMIVKIFLEALLI